MTDTPKSGSSEFQASHLGCKIIHGTKNQLFVYLLEKSNQIENRDWIRKIGH